MILPVRKEIEENPEKRWVMEGRGRVQRLMQGYAWFLLAGPLLLCIADTPPDR